MAAPADAHATRPVYLGDEPIGVAHSWLEVIGLLTARGLSERDAANALLTRRVETAKAFHIIAAGGIEQMLAKLRAIRAREA